MKRTQRLLPSYRGHLLSHCCHQRLPLPGVAIKANVHNSAVEVIYIHVPIS